LEQKGDESWGRGEKGRKETDCKALEKMSGKGRNFKFRRGGRGPRHERNLRVGRGRVRPESEAESRVK